MISMAQNKVHIRSIALLLLVSVGLSLGCQRSQGLVPVAGYVLIDGKPLTHGDVIVAPHGQRPALGKLDSAGKFVLTTSEPGDGTVVGTHPVAIRAAEFTDQFHRQWYAPKKYSDAGSSGLTLTIDGPTDAAKIQLTWEGGHPFAEAIEGGGQ